LSAAYEPLPRAIEPSAPYDSLSDATFFLRQSKRTFVLQADPWVPAMEHPIVVFARREGKPEEYAARSVLLKVGR